MDLLDWLRLYWRQDTQQTKWLCWCREGCWLATNRKEAQCQNQ